ncbi:hypothetical protein ACFQFC_02255 [Amorphoplanes digitatis]|uniref:Uncharacterized protein n=1 Tax=Actinoplanes digitatis TaxID=1868 RepID=A0A7W7HYA3_9ACTN|nr:hypothetical protein [Actinoplanes digitatis]MBB4763000.1 hypothetical protein [Actinoplanes digitatis]BFE71974.1 hypothetical protein GCM10020092_052750 [Actinoplanes digitatis]GID95799.1 hypothetical protein Adi01nite_52110 [Actinoplanes digitatis]
MERQRKATMSRTAFTTGVIGFLLVGAAFLIVAVLVLSGTVTVAQRVVFGLVAIALGGAAVAAAALQLKQGRTGTRPAPADTRTENGPGAAGFGIGEPDDARFHGPGQHPGVGEF